MASVGGSRDIAGELPSQKKGTLLKFGNVVQLAKMEYVLRGGCLFLEQHGAVMGEGLFLVFVILVGYLSSLQATAPAAKVSC